MYKRLTPIDFDDLDEYIAYVVREQKKKENNADTGESINKTNDGRNSRTQYDNDLDL